VRKLIRPAEDSGEVQDLVVVEGEEAVDVELQEVFHFLYLKEHFNSLTCSLRRKI
jgi:hypothetical protein